MSSSQVIPGQQAPAGRLPLEGETLGRILVRGPDYKIDHDTGCWIWQKALDKRGYGAGKPKPHRRYFQRANPTVPIEGLHIHHRCENKACVNPDHLQVATPSAHISYHQRAAKRKLTYEDAREIRRLGADPANSATLLAKRYGVSRRHIDDIWRGLRFQEPGVAPVTWTRNCRYCGELFTRPNRNAMYCSTAHRTAYARRKATA